VRVAVLALVVGLAGPVAAKAPETGPKVSKLTVMATAYNATEAQTDGEPHIGAWGDHLDRAVQPGLRVIAVSPDLLQKGLRRGQRVRIRGLKGEFVVLDKMPRRWTNRIDIYMQQDVRGARRWGRRRVTLYWTEPS
jgi:3D (Asp-Asp-Asp) domain-containing protein